MSASDHRHIILSDERVLIDPTRSYILYPGGPTRADIIDNEFKWAALYLVGPAPTGQEWQFRSLGKGMLQAGLIPIDPDAPVTPPTRNTRADTKGIRYINGEKLDS